MKIELTGVRQDDAGHWIIDRVITLDDGTRHEGVYIMPVDILEWRAAEYGIDPADADTLLDIVLAEHHLEPTEMQRSPLYDEADLQVARERHIARCVQAKLRMRMSTRGQGHVLNRVREESPRDPEAIALKRRIAEHARAHQRGLTAAVRSAELPAREHRLQALRQAVKDLTGKEG